MCKSLLLAIKKSGRSRCQLVLSFLLMCLPIIPIILVITDTKINSTYETTLSLYLGVSPFIFIIGVLLFIRTVQQFDQPVLGGYLADNMIRADIIIEQGFEIPPEPVSQVLEPKLREKLCSLLEEGAGLDEIEQIPQLQMESTYIT